MNIMRFQQIKDNDGNIYVHLENSNMTREEIIAKAEAVRAKRLAEEALHPHLPTHDEETGKLLLTKNQLKEGAYYVGRCRNASVARWVNGCFYYWRYKFDILFLEAAKHPADEEQFDVFRPLRELPNPKFEIPEWACNDFTGDIKEMLEFLNEHNAEVWCGGCTEDNPCIHHKNALRGEK